MDLYMLNVTIFNIFLAKSCAEQKYAILLWQFFVRTSDLTRLELEYNLIFMVRCSNCCSMLSII